MVTSTKFPREQLPLEKKTPSRSNFLEEKWIFPREQLLEGEKDFPDFLWEKWTKLPKRKKDLECCELLGQKCRR
jgi:hypothetical protein